MAAFVLTDTKIFVGAFDQSCFGDTVSLDRSGDVVEVSTFCSGGNREYVPGLSSWSATFGGPQDLATSTASTTYKPDEYYTLNIGSTYPVMFVPGGDAEGVVAFASQGLLNGYTPLSGSVGAKAGHNLQVAKDGTYQLVRGVYATKATITATLGGTGYNLGAVAAGKSVYASVHLLTAGGTTPNITPVLESDDNSGFTSPTTRISFASQTTRTAEFKLAAGAITDTWWRLSYVVSGTSPSFQVRSFIGIQ